MSCAEILAFYTEFEQFMEFYWSLCRFCSKSMWKKSVRRKSVWRKNDKYEVWIKITQEGTTWKMSSIKTMLFLKGAFTSRKVGFTGHVWQKIIATIIWDKIIKTRSSWLNCALRDDEALYWVSIGHYEAVAVDNWWYWVSRGHSCLYILQKVEIWTGVTDASLTHSQLWKIVLLSSL